MFGGFGGGMMRGYGYGFGPGGGAIGNLAGGFGWLGLVGMLIHLLVWVGIFFLVFYFIRRWTGKPARLSHSSGALNILQERYARGELTTEEYQQMKKELS